MTILKLASLNVRFFAEKAVKVSDLIRDHKLDVLFLFETWVDSGCTFILTEASLPSFNFLIFIKV